MENIEKGVYKIYCDNGYYIFKLEKLLDSIGKSKYQMAIDLQSEYKVLNRYAHGNLTRFDTQVIARICNYCNCKMSDIIEFYPSNKN